MNPEKLKLLVQERTLLKQLVRVNPGYLMLFNARIAELKQVINTAYSEHVDLTAHLAIYLHDKELADEITKNATQILKELNGIK